MSFSWLFRLRGDLTPKQKAILTTAGLVFILIIWHILTMGEEPIIPKNFFPQPLKVRSAYYELIRDKELIKNLCRSIGLNLGGYLKAILYAIPLGFAIGLVPMFRGAFQKVVDTVRFLPLTALTAMFILWYGSGVEAKINFLAFGIFIYLLPIVVQRIDEVDDVYLKTVHTLGANYWQTITTVYFPSVVSRLSDDIRILTAISWTYIIVVETNADDGGIGSLMFRAGQRFARVDVTFACLVIIMLFGVFQDKIFVNLDKKFFPYKYQIKNTYEGRSELKKVSLFVSILDYVKSLATWLSLGIYILLIINESSPFSGSILPLSYLFGDALWTIHVIFGLILVYQLNSLYQKFTR
ncbi:MAG TPA: ABC transporter permease subunit [Saprospiraceae bacterium]|nr:ABC transporter permease subunit [Saprospiraceae bacterium]